MYGLISGLSNFWNAERWVLTPWSVFWDYNPRLIEYWGIWLLYLWRAVRPVLVAVVRSIHNTKYKWVNVWTSALLVAMANHTSRTYRLLHGTQHLNSYFCPPVANTRRRSTRSVAPRIRTFASSLEPLCFSEEVDFWFFEQRVLCRTANNEVAKL